MRICEKQNLLIERTTQNGLFLQKLGGIDPQIGGYPVAKKMNSFIININILFTYNFFIIHKSIIY